MFEPPNGDACEKPTGTNANDKPSEVLKNFLLKWETIGTLFAIIFGTLWAKYGDSLIGFILIILGICCLFFLVCHKLFIRRWSRYGVPSVLSALIVMGTFLVVKMNPEDVQRGSNPLWQPPELPKGTKVAYLHIGERIFEFQIDALKDKKSFFSPPIEENFCKIRLRDNRLYLYMKLWSGTEDKPVGPDDGDANLAPTYQRNFSEFDFEVVNQDLVPTFQMEYADRGNIITINGLFPVVSGPTNREPIALRAVFGNNSTLYRITNGYAQARKISLNYANERVFEYPSKKYRGKYRTPAPAEAKDGTPFIEGTKLPPPPKLIAGTTFTHDVISEIFPYGYGLLFVSDSEPTRHEVFMGTNSLIKWDVDWRNILLKRDVAAGVLEISAPFRIETPDRAEGPQIHFSGPDGGYSKMFFRATVKTGWMSFASIIYVRNKPTLCVLTLNDNQRKPVFAIGFRILTDEEMNRPRKPN